MPFAPLTPTSAPAARLASALDRAARSWAGQGVLRVEVPAAPAEALAWAAAQSAPTSYWRGRGDADARASTGAALALDAPSLDAVDPAVLDSLPPDARLTATARFDVTAEVGEEWRAFGAVRLVLPRIEFRSDGATAALALHLAPGESPSDAAAALAAVRMPAPVAAGLSLPFMRRDDPDRAEWDRMLRRALAAIRAGRLDKVVLARRARYLFDEPVDAIALLRQLEAATPRCYHALVAPMGASGPTFLTATPERLLRIDGRRLSTEAVAGTRPRAEADAADDRLRAELLDSEKDQREHAFVVRAIVDALAPLAESVEADDRAGAMTLARGRHLRTGIRATLADGVGVVDVLRALHPTPAVGGTPTPGALDAIDRLEPFDRGLYAGPIGWIGRDAAGALAADLAVGIRSGLADGRSLSLYSGAGIVAGSDPEAEWAEIEHKIGDFARVLGLDARAAA
ncbi:isochorismate synthase MenF [Rubrivirga sp. IMCC45206]|uniref:isochorismate synthase n=1 Tax=Rubrivirga sp. IMCC45206 TaxID=3391614 RepID=UPI00398FBB66